MVRAHALASCADARAALDLVPEARALAGPLEAERAQAELVLVGEAAQQRHRRMGVRIHEARHQDVILQLQFLIPGEPDGGLLRGKNCFDPAVAHSDGMLLEHRARGLDRNDPAGAEEGALRYLGEPCTSTTTRRFGPRQSIVDLRSFWSGQDFTGSVLPKPKTSTLPASVPLDTR